MAHMQLEGPPGYKELCAKLQVERNPARFRALVEMINRLLHDHEKSSASESSVQPDFQAISLDVLVSASAINS